MKSVTYSLTVQGRCASRSIGAQIAEAWAKRHDPEHFISQLTDADSEQQETCRLGELMARADPFCQTHGHHRRETPPNCEVSGSLSYRLED